MGSPNFDDLIPKASPAAAGLTFDDLMPAAEQPPMFSDPVSEANWHAAHPQAAPPVSPSAPTYSGSILPFSRYADGSVGFDSNAGVVGALKRAFTLPGDVATGKVDPNSQEAIGRSADMAGLGTNDLAGAGAGGFGMVRAAKVIPPTAEALRAAGGAGFDAARNMGVNYASPAVADMARQAQQGLNDLGVLPELAPQTHAILNKLQAVPAGESVAPFGSLDAARKSFGLIGQNFNNPTDKMAAGRAKSALEQFLTGSDPTAVVSGPAAQASKTLAEAIANYGAGMRSDRLNGIEDAAGLRADAAHSGQNIGNATRQRTASLILNDRASSGFNEDELAALRGVTEGTPASNSARYLGNLLGGGGGLGHAMTAMGGATVGHEAAGLPGMVLGASLPIVGTVAKKLDNAWTQQRLREADELVRSRSPLARALAAQAPQEIDPAAKRAALARALMISGAQPQGSN